MESPQKLTVPSEVVFCRGRSCDNMRGCAAAEACLYKSSADEFRERRDTFLEENKAQLAELDTGTVTFEPINPTYEKGHVKDFTGTVTGAGYKASMDDPKKIPLALIDPTFTDGVGRVLRHGAKKYAPGNWLNGMSWREVISALKRHTSAIERGEDVDPETGELHVYHIGCCTMFLARYMSDARYATFDDRMFK